MYQKLKEFTYRFIQPTEQEWQFFLTLLEHGEVSKKGFLLKAGEVCDFVAFINKGSFRTYRIFQDKEATSNFFFDGNYVTEYSSFLTRQPCKEYIQALEDSEVLLLRYHKMQEGYEKYQVWERFGRLIAEFLYLMISDRRDSFLFKTPEERYLSLFNERPKVVEKMPQNYIASYLGVAPESLSRIRKRITERKS